MDSTPLERSIMEQVFTALSLLCVINGVSGSADLLHTLESPDPTSSGFFGCAVSSSEDLNADGYDEVIVGAEGEGRGGAVHLFSGKTGELLYTLSTPESHSSDLFGCSVAGPGDLNDNGYADLVVGTDGGYPGDKAYVFDGESGSLLLTLRSPAGDDYGGFGRVVATAGDVNNDGRRDIIIGAKTEESDPANPSSGRAYVFSGNNCELLLTLAAPVEKWGAFFGSSVAGAGDVNGDGYDDLLVGADSENSDAGFVNQGRAYVFSGQTGSVIWVLDSPDGHAYGWFGRSVAGVGDLNADGFGDLAIGELGAQIQGLVQVFDGRTGAHMYTLMSPGDAASHFGTSIAGVDDVNGNGCDELLVGALYDSPGYSPGLAGRAYLFDGARGDLLQTFISPNEQFEGYFGCSVAGAGDLNSDGQIELLVGAEREEPAGAPSYAGRAYVFTQGPVSGPDAPWANPSDVHLLRSYPNPTNGAVTLDLDLALGGSLLPSVDLSLVDISGRVVARVPLSGESGDDRIRVRWHNAGLSSGLYWWHLRAGNLQVPHPMLLIR